jgi:hypothetical protein
MVWKLWVYAELERQRKQSQEKKKNSLKNQFFTHPITTKSKNEPNPDHTCTRKRNLNKTKIKTH